MNRQAEVVTADDVSIETFIDGDAGAPDVVVLPSYGRGVEDFDDFATRLAEAGHRVLRPQPRGIGRSSGPMTGVTIDQLGADIGHVIDRLGNGPAVILGHAYGSFVARAVATNEPEKVRAVILAAASTQAPPREINEAPFRAGDLSLPESDRLAALQLAFFAPGHDARAWLTGWYPETLAMQRSAIVGIDASHYWGAGRAPILEILAELDPFHPKEQWSDLRNQLGLRVTSVVIEGASHALFPEQGEAVVRVIDDYLEAL